MLWSWTRLKQLSALLLLASVIGGTAVGATYQQPTVESVETEWGMVTEDRTDIEADVTIENPNAVPAPGVFDVETTARLNGVVVAEGTRSGLGLDRGRNELSLAATMDNDAIGEWWLAHVADDERSNLTITATVVGPGGMRKTIPVREQTVDTDLFGPITKSQPRTVSLQSEDLVAISNTTANWQSPRNETTPLRFAASVENRHDSAIAFDAFAYTIQLNNVTVGAGRSQQGLAVEPGETERLAVDAAIDARKMSEWWPGHVRNEESSTVTVRIDGLVEEDGQLERLPLSLYQSRLAFETDLLGGGETTVRTLERSTQRSAAQPTVTETTLAWGEITDAESPIRSTVTVDNPGDTSTAEFATLSASQSVAINGIDVASNTEGVGPLEPGANTIRTRVALDNAKVPQWWARHVNNDERSRVSATSSLAADIGSTTVEVRNETREHTVRTDVLEGFRDGTDRPVVVGGIQAATIEQTSAQWEQATAAQSPIELTVTVSNDVPVPIAIDGFRYRIRMNGVIVGNDTAPESYTLEPGERKQLTFTLVVDSQQMDAWWVSHLRNDEQTTLAVDASARVAGAGIRTRVDLSDSIERQEITTDVLGGLASDSAGSNG